MLLPNETLDDIEHRAGSLMDSHFELLERLIAYREERGLTQSDIAKRMGVTQAAISQFERMDSNPTLQTVRRYAAAVAVRIEHRIIDDLAVRDFTQTEYGVVIPMADVRRNTSKRRRSGWSVSQPMRVANLG